MFFEGDFAPIFFTAPGKKVNFTTKNSIFLENLQNVIYSPYRCFG